MLTDEKLHQYAALVIQYNNAFNLTGAKTEDDFFSSQIQDVVSGAEFFTPFKDKTIYDIGSGCGLPGIVLSILMPETKFILVERSKKRANFLKIAISLLSLNACVEVQERELGYYKNCIEVATFRALGLFSDIEKDLLASLADNGNVLMFKGKLAEVIEENYNNALWNVDISQYDFMKKSRCMVKLSKK